MDLPPKRDPRPSLGNSLANLRQPGSLTWKLERYTANMLARLRRRSTCCGHPGEPGC
ncbi:MAG: hypothetical protein M3336_10265 [Chloroflexota bacterium]|nr:hypothetical protein [Chloroflexota bacterium]